MKVFLQKLINLSINKKLFIAVFCFIYYYLSKFKLERNDPKVLKLFLKNTGLWDNRDYTSECDCRRTETIKIAQSLTEGNYKVYSTKNGTSGYSVTETELNKLKCDPYNSLRRGRNQKVIGISLYGNKEKYHELIKPLAFSVNQSYPGWVLRVYHDSSFIKETKCELECLPTDNVDFCDIEKMPGLPFEHFSSNDEKIFHSRFHNEWNASFVHGMMWRWFPIGDLLVDVLLSRDSDCRLYQREIDAVSVWLSSNKTGHIMRDHPKHTSLILGKQAMSIILEYNNYIIILEMSSHFRFYNDCLFNTFIIRVRNGIETRPRKCI
jgi:hypothetical protein